MKNGKTVLQNLNIIDTIHKFDKWGCGCDYLRLNYKESSEFIEQGLELIDIDNSNFYTREIGGTVFTFSKMPTPNGFALNFSCSFNDVVVPCGQFVKFNENARHLFNSYGKLDFYGSMFRLVDMGFLQKSIFLLFKVLISEENPKVTRFDYRLDFFSMKKFEIPEIEDFVKYVHVQSKTQEFRNGGVLTNWLVGTKTNGRYAIRYYDKLLDSDSKEKVFLYQDYFIYNSVHRLEFEFQPNFLRGYDFYDFINGTIIQRINIILGLGEKLFEGPLFYQYQEDYIIQDKDKSKYLRRYSTMSLKLSKNGINPLIQCYRSLFLELEDDELKKNVFQFLDFIGQDKHKYRLKYDNMKELFISLHNI